MYFAYLPVRLETVADEFRRRSSFYVKMETDDVWDAPFGYHARRTETSPRTRTDSRLDRTVCAFLTTGVGDEAAGGKRLANGAGSMEPGHSFGQGGVRGGPTRLPLDTIDRFRDRFLSTVFVLYFTPPSTFVRFV